MKTDMTTQQAITMYLVIEALSNQFDRDNLMRKQPSIEILNKQVEAFNAKHKEGDRVRVKTDSGTIIETTVKSEAWVMGGHSVMVRLDAFCGGYLAERVQ